MIISEPLGRRLPEVARLEALDALGILDTAPEPAFEAMVDLACALFDTPMAVVTFVDCQRQWFKARRGISATETKRDIAICARVVDTGGRHRARLQQPPHGHPQLHRPPAG